MVAHHVSIANTCDGEGLLCIMVVLNRCGARQAVPRGRVDVDREHKTVGTRRESASCSVNGAGSGELSSIRRKDPGRFRSRVRPGKASVTTRQAYDGDSEPRYNTLLSSGKWASIPIRRLWRKADLWCALAG